MMSIGVADVIDWMGALVVGASLIVPSLVLAYGFLRYWWSERSQPATAATPAERPVLASGSLPAGHLAAYTVEVHPTAPRPADGIAVTELRCGEAA